MLAVGLGTGDVPGVNSVGEPGEEDTVAAGVGDTVAAVVAAGVGDAIAAVVAADVGDDIGKVVGDGTVV